MEDDPKIIDLIRQCRWSFFDGQWHCQSPQSEQFMKNNPEFVDCLCGLPEICEERFVGKLF